MQFCWVINLISLPLLHPAKSESVHSVKALFQLHNQWLHELHLCVLAVPPSTFTCTLTWTQMKDNASFHIQGRVSISYPASQPCRAHNESLHQWPHLLSWRVQMGVNRLSPRHHLLPSHYRAVSYFYGVCIHYTPVKVVHPLMNAQAHCLFFLRHANPQNVPEPDLIQTLMMLSALVKARVCQMETCHGWYITVWNVITVLSRSRPEGVVFYWLFWQRDMRLQEWL